MNIPSFKVDENGFRIHLSGCGFLNRENQTACNCSSLVIVSHLEDADFPAKAYQYKTARVATSLNSVFAYGEFVSVVRVRSIGARIVFHCRRDSKQEYLFDNQLGEFCL